MGRVITAKDLEAQGGVEQRLRWRVEDVLSDKLTGFDDTFLMGGVSYEVSEVEDGLLDVYDVEGNTLCQYMWEVIATFVPTNVKEVNPKRIGDLP